MKLVLVLTLVVMTLAVIAAPPGKGKDGNKAKQEVKKPESPQKSLNVRQGNMGQGAGKGAPVDVGKQSAPGVKSPAQSDLKSNASVNHKPSDQPGHTEPGQQAQKEGQKRPVGGGEKSQRGKGVMDKGEKSEKGEAGDKISEKSEKGEKVANMEKGAEKNRKGEKIGERAEKGEKGDRAEKGEKVGEKSDNGEKVGKFEKGDTPEKGEKSDKRGKGKKSEKDDKNDKHEGVKIEKGDKKDQGLKQNQDQQDPSLAGMQAPLGDKTGRKMNKGPSVDQALPSQNSDTLKVKSLAMPVPSLPPMDKDNSLKQSPIDIPVMSGKDFPLPMPQDILKRMKIDPTKGIPSLPSLQPGSFPMMPADMMKLIPSLGDKDGKKDDKKMTGSEIKIQSVPQMTSMNAAAQTEGQQGPKPAVANASAPSSSAAPPAVPQTSQVAQKAPTAPPAKKTTPAESEEDAGED